MEKPLYSFMENVWLLEPVLELSKNMTVCKNKVSQMRGRTLLGILRTQQYTRSRERCWATDSRKYAKETINDGKINEVHPNSI